MGNYDAGDYDLLIVAPGSDKARVIRGFTGLDDWRRDKNPGPRRGPGGRGLGMNHQRNANIVMFSVKVDQASLDLSWMRDLAELETEVAVYAVVTRNLDKYDVGQEIGLGGELCVLVEQGTSLGSSDESGDVVFEVRAIGATRKNKE